MHPVGTTNGSARAEWVERKLISLPSGGRILDAGAGEQRFEPCCEHLEYVSQDFGEYDPRESGVGLHPDEWNHGKLDIVSDITKIPEPDASFDAILCTEVLEHVPDPLAALKEFHRLLRPGGRLLLTVPFVSATHFAPYHFSTGFSRYYFELHLKNFGFTIDEINLSGNFFELLAQETRRARDVARQYTDRRLSFFDKYTLRMFISLLGKLSANDCGSSELACYSVFVEATRGEN